MKLSPRLIRQFIIAAVFLGAFVFLGYGSRQLTTAPPTCTDGIQNGQEEGVDCGAAACSRYCEVELEPPRVISTKLIKAKGGDYDFIAEILNPHQEFGSPEVAYQLVLYGAEDKEELRREDSFYILPGQTKFLILPALITEKEVLKTDLKIKSVKWQKIESLEGMNFSVRRKEYVPRQNGQSSTLDAIIFNDSDFDFMVVDVDVILLNEDKEVIGVNKTDIRTFIAMTERHFQSAWPFPIREKVYETDIRVSTNLFDNINFIKRYGSEVQKFQTY